MPCFFENKSARKSHKKKVANIKTNTVQDENHEKHSENDYRIAPIHT
jgi:hypothetical protein